jgi:hypothetical protein
VWYIQLQDGDIICFQRAYTRPIFRFSTVPEFFLYVKNKQEVTFRKLDAPKEQGLTLELSKLMSYNEVCERLAAELQVADAQLLRLTAHNVFSGHPVRCPFSVVLSNPSLRFASLRVWWGRWSAEEELVQIQRHRPPAGAAEKG